MQPNVEDQKGWINLCCGSNETEYKALLPTLDVILALNQPTIENVLEYLVEFIEEQGIIQFDLGRWIYVLLVALELPLNPDMCSCLRSLARACSMIRAKLVIIRLLQIPKILTFYVFQPSNFLFY